MRGIVAARLDALPAAERALLLDAAVVGKISGAARSSGSPASRRLPELLGALEGRDLVVRERVSIIEGDQQFASSTS